MLHAKSQEIRGEFVCLCACLSALDAVLWHCQLVPQALLLLLHKHYT